MFDKYALLQMVDEAISILEGKNPLVSEDIALYHKLLEIRQEIKDNFTKVNVEDYIHIFIMIVKLIKDFFDNNDS